VCGLDGSPLPFYHLLQNKLPELTQQECWSGFEYVGSANAATLPSLYRGRTILLLGDTARKAVGLPKMLIHPMRFRGVEWRQLPNPNGSWYDDLETRDLAASLLAELYERGRNMSQ
jgi:hypothetical protein